MTSWSRRIDVDTTSFWCCLPAGKIAIKSFPSNRQLLYNIFCKTLFRLECPRLCRCALHVQVNCIHTLTITVYSPNIGTIYHTCPKIWTSPFYYPLMCQKLLDKWQTTSTLIRRRVLWRLIRIYTVCLGLSVPILGLNTVLMPTHFGAVLAVWLRPHLH